MQIIFRCEKCGYEFDDISSSEFSELSSWTCLGCGKDGWCFDCHRPFQKCVCLNPTWKILERIHNS